MKADVKSALPHLRLLAASLLGAVMLATAGAPAQTNETLPPVLTNLAQVRALGPVGVRQLKRPVHVRGVVTYVHSQREHIFLQDETGAMLIPVTNPGLCPAFAMDVEVRGVTGTNGTQWGIMDGQFTVHGPGTLPEPAKATLAEVQAIRHRLKWIEVEGVVLQARKHSSRSAVLQLADLSGVSTVGLVTTPDSFTPTNLIGARVRAQGLNVRAGLAPLLMQEVSLLSVLSPGQADPFKATATTASVLRNSAPTVERVSLRGTVLRTIYRPSSQSGIYIRDDTGAFQTALLAPQPTNDPTYQYTQTIPLADVHPGDVVEVVGSPTVTTPNLFLQHAQLRVLGAGPEPEPISVTTAEVAAGQFPSDLVTVRGRLLGRHQVTTGRNLWRDVLRLTADGHEVSVFLDSNVSDRFATLPLNDLIEARGLVVPEDGAAPGLPAKKYLVQVTSVADVRSLGLAPEVARNRTLQLTGGVAILVLLAGSWIALLRSRLARERRIATERERSEAAIREANTSLERRVAERTVELEKAREETARALATERELNALKTRFVSIVSHEFRTPLGIIMSAVELLRNYQDRLPAPKRDELHADIYGSTRQMAGLMEQVLVLGRVEGGRLEFKPKPVDLAALCEKLADESLSATGHRCQIDLRIDGPLGGTQGDEALLRHLFSNLLSNAVKYSPAGSTVEFSVRRDGADAVFSVRDRGIGIPETHLPHLFEPFRRASNVGETPGTGLGMLIVKRCVELQSGRIEIQSKVGEGTTVMVSLPMFAVVPAP